MAILEPLATNQWQNAQIVLNLRPGLWTDAEFFEFCQANRDVRIEMTAQGRLVIMPPAGMESGGRNANLTADLVLWNRQAKLGKVFDSSTGFTLPNGAKRSPDASWIELSRWNALSLDDRKGFAPVCPDFVAELRSESDSLPELREKMQEYLANGARLGWLLDPRHRLVEIYRPHHEVEILTAPQTLSGETVLPGFVLHLAEILW